MEAEADESEATSAHATGREVALRRYIGLHKAFIESGASGVPAGMVRVPGRGLLPRRFIQVTPCCQLCNRVRVLVSALALGVLTDRAVLIEFDKGYYGALSDLFASPLALQAPVHKDVRVGRSRTVSWLHAMKELMCDAPLEWDEGLVTLQGSPSFLHSLLLTPSLTAKFEAAFGTADGLYADIVRTLLVPQPSLLREAAQFYRKLTGPVTPGSAPPFVVGLHVRNGRDFRSKKLSSVEWGRVAGCAKALVPRGRQALYLVATESEESRSLAAEALPGALFYEQSLPKGKKANGTVSREGARRSLLELLLISQADANVLTPMSSFSEMAAALARRPGLYFHFDLARKFHYESATEALPGCFVPFTAEMPGSMNLKSIVRRLPCGTAVRAAGSTSDDASSRQPEEGADGALAAERRLWTHPTGLRFLDGEAKLPEALAKSVTEY